MSLASFRRRAAPATLCAAALATLTFAAPAAADAPQADGLLDESAIAAHPGEHGYFIDNWERNDTNLADYSPETNPAIGVLGEFEEIASSGETWDEPVINDEALHLSNIAQSVEISRNATDEEQGRAYVIDRRNQNYTAAEGLGAYFDAYGDAVDLGTTIPDKTPEEANTTKLEDGGNENGNWAENTGELGDTVELVQQIRWHAASGNPSKEYFQYKRPFRWSDEVDQPDYAQVLRKPASEGASDGGFPSGHTNAGHMAADGLAYAFPQQYTELMLKAAEIGTSRIELGMHSPLDVMGGRILSTAITAGALNDPDLGGVADDGLKKSALDEAQTWLADQDIEPNEIDYDEALATYTAYMTFGFEQTGDTTEAVRVPKGAEALIESRYPYLSDDERRWVLQSTGLESGYPLNDDAEGWGRINLLAAANGYGAFDHNVEVALDADGSALEQADEWKNDIDGAGSLTLDGTGTLTLSGDNSYTGGTTITGGELVAATGDALGAGSVANEAGTLSAEQALSIDGDFAQASGATLALADGATVTATGTATLGGTLELASAPADGTTLVTAGAIDGSFDAVTVDGQAIDTYVDGGVLFAGTAPADDATPGDTPSETAAPAPVETTAPAPAETTEAAAPVADETPEATAEAGSEDLTATGGEPSGLLVAIPATAVIAGLAILAIRFVTRRRGNRA